MITEELLENPNVESILGVNDLDTKDFILSLFSNDNYNIENALNLLQNHIVAKKPISILAMKLNAYNFQYYKQTHDTIMLYLDVDNVYNKILNHSVLGYYALLKEYISPSTSDWNLEQIKLYNPAINQVTSKDKWISKKSNISIGWEEGAQFLANIICDRFDTELLKINNILNKKLTKKNLSSFFDLKEIKDLTGNDGYLEVKKVLL
mgnify:CR=1 FL=1